MLVCASVSVSCFRRILLRASRLSLGQKWTAPKRCKLCLFSEITIRVENRHFLPFDEALSSRAGIVIAYGSADRRKVFGVSQITNKRQEIDQMYVSTDRYYEPRSWLRNGPTSDPTFSVATQAEDRTVLSNFTETIGDRRKCQFGTL